MRSSQSGIATLPTALALGAITIAVVVSITALSLSESFISQGFSQSAQALIYAEGGARDALVRIARNKSYVCATTDCYNIPFMTNGCTLDAACAYVSVSAGVGSVGDPKIITAKGKVRNTSRTLQASVVYDTDLNGQIQTVTWQEITN